MRAWIAGLSALALLGIVLALIGDGLADAVAVCLVGGAAVGAVSLGFFTVGRSEDRAREAEAAARGDAKPDAERPGDGRITARRPPRSRGDS